MENKLGVRLKAFRDGYLKVSQPEFARLTGLTQGNVSHIETGRSQPIYTNLQKVYDAFPMLNPTWLATGEGGMLIDPTLSKSSKGVSDKSATGEVIEELKAAYEKVVDALKDSLAKAEQRERWYQEQLSKPSAA